MILVFLLPLSWALRRGLCTPNFGIVIQRVVGLGLSAVLWILPAFRVVTVVSLQQRILIAMADLPRPRNVALLLRTVLLNRALARIFITSIFGYSET